jgi:3-methyladenine DNA glycosylase AlkD
VNSYADQVLDRLVPAYRAAADRERAAGQAAYLRDRFRFLGLAMPERRKLDRAVLAGLPRPAEDDLRDTVLRCWDRAEREYQHFACDLLRAHPAVPGAGFLATLRTLITTKSWWDTVDPLATRTVGDLVRRHRGLTATMDEWSAAEDLWLIRTAIGWALRQYARTDPSAVRQYVDAHRDELSPLSVREAAKHL